MAVPIRELRICHHIGKMAVPVIKFRNTTKKNSGVTFYSFFVTCII